MTSDFEIVTREPSTILPAQTSLGPRWNADTSGPRALMLAVLEDAVRCIEEGRRANHHRARRLAREAEAWVRCGCREWPFSFVNICEVLGFDVEAMRAHLLTSPRDSGHSRRIRLRVPVRIGAVLVLVALAMGLASGSAHAAAKPTAAQQCAATKRKLAGKKAAALTMCDAAAVATGIAVDASCETQAKTGFTTAWTKAETAARGGCPRRTT